MHISIIIGSVVACGMAAWWGTKTYERVKAAARVRELESKIRLAQGETVQLREQLGLLKGELSILQKTLSEERVSKQTALAAISESFKRGVFAVGTMALAVGVISGGSVSWQAATWRAEAQKAHHNYEADLQNRLNGLKVEFMEKQILRYEKELDQYRGAWHEEQVQKAVAQTKLEIIMTSLAPQKGVEGFALDYKKLKNGLKKNLDMPAIDPLYAR